ncbi:MAG: hypothetical protein IPQ09_23480 [Myxococcales bacterium]|nr:hypothetical protein [Myxococcales bacterium]
MRWLVVAPAALSLAALLLVPSCSSVAGPGGGVGGEAGAAGQVQEIAEQEPNDGPEFAGMQALGALDPSKGLKIAGRLTSGGNDGSRYTGDFDVFSFEVPAGGGSIAAQVDWTGTADVDVLVYDANLNVLGGDNTSAKPVSSTAQFAAGKYAVALLSKDQAADWTFTMTFTKPGGGSDGGGGGGGGGGCLDTATLTATWWQPASGGILEQIKFYENGKCDYEYYNSTSGASPYACSYSLACPNLSAKLESGSTYNFTVVDGVLVRDGIRWLRCTKPVSSGKCF